MRNQRSLLALPILLFVFFSFNLTGNNSNTTNAEIADVWHVKAIHPSGQLLGVKAIDANGFIYSVKAYHRGSPYMMDIKAVINGREVGIKVLKSTDKYAPVKAIGMDGTIYKIKAIDLDKKFLDVKGVSQAGNLINIKAIAQDGTFYPVKALSSSGSLLDVKGLSFEETVNKTFNGVDIIGHVKAVPQMFCGEENMNWAIKAFHPMGEMMDVVAIDKSGQVYPLVAMPNDGNYQLMDVKVKMQEELVAVKVVIDDEKFHRIKAIMTDGTILDVMAIDPYEELLEIRAVNRKDNILSVKAIATSGNFYGVKAINSNGYLYDVKAIKLQVEDLEAVVNQVKVYAHVKAFPQLIK